MFLLTLLIEFIDLILNYAGLTKCVHHACDLGNRSLFFLSSNSLVCVLYGPSSPFFSNLAILLRVYECVLMKRDGVCDFVL